MPLSEEEYTKMRDYYINYFEELRDHVANHPQMPKEVAEENIQEMDRVSGLLDKLMQERNAGLDQPDELHANQDANESLVNESSPDAEEISTEGLTPEEDTQPSNEAVETEEVSAEQISPEEETAVAEESNTAEAQSPKAENLKQESQAAESNELSLSNESQPSADLTAESLSTSQDDSYGYGYGY